MSLDSVNIRVSNAENNIINSINRNSKLLGEVNGDITKHTEYLKNVSARELNFNGFGQVLLTSAGGTAVKADTTCVVQEDPEHRIGWNLTNSVAGTKFNLYYFNGNQETITLGSVLSAYFKGFINVNTEAFSIPFIHIYTKPTGSGDAGAFYHSRIDYTYNDDSIIGIGEECVFYAEAEPKTLFSNRKVKLSNKVVNGDGEADEEVLYMTVSTDTSATINAMNTTLNVLGFDANQDQIPITRNLLLISESSLTGGATEAKQDDMITDLNSIDTNTGIVSGAVVAGQMRVNITTDDVGLATESTLSSVDGKISKGEDGTITGGGGGLQQVLLYGRDQTTDLHPIRITPQGDIDVEIAEYPKGQETSANSFPVVIASDQSNLNTKLIAEDFSSVERPVKTDNTGRLVVQVDGIRNSGSESIGIADGTTGYSSEISMGTFTRIAFYGDTDNTTNTNIFIEYSQDGVNWFRGAGDNAKIIIVASSGNFYDEEIITAPRVRIARPNTSGSAETLQLYYTQL